MNFKTDSIFKSVSYDVDANSWNFVFDKNIGLYISGFWRLLKDDKIILVSLDHGQQFGLPKPVDLQELTTIKLTGKKLLSIDVKKDTFDLLLTFTERLKLEVFIASTGYETYNFSINDNHYIGLGSGDLTIY